MRHLLVIATVLLAGCEHDGHFAKPDECLVRRDFANRNLMTVQNDQKWCSFKWVGIYGGGDVPITGGGAPVKPEHGALRVQDLADATWYRYRPAPGYTGPDSFQIAPAGPVAGGRTFTIEVNVTAPALPQPPAVASAGAR